MPGTKKPSALQRVRELSDKNDWRSDETTSENAVQPAGEKPREANSDSDMSPSLLCQEHLVPSAAGISDEQATVDNPTLVDESAVVDKVHVANGADEDKEATGVVDQDRMADLPDGAPEVKRRKICIPEVKLW